MTADEDLPVVPGEGIRNIYSRCPFKIDVFDADDDKRPLTSATAFFVEYEGDWFIITNGHVVRGLHAFTGEPLDGVSKDRFPQRLRLLLSKHTELEGGDRYIPTAYACDLYVEDQPTWYVHPSLGHRCDVVAREVDWPKEEERLWHPAINRISDDQVPVRPGVTVFILGYPQGISVKLGMPVWKSGYIASEPFFPITVEQDPESERLTGPLEGLPAFFIDSQTRPGMSGAPIIAQYTGTWDRTDPYKTPTLDDGLRTNLDNLVFGDTKSEFIGCYSGRIQSPELDAGLGICWRKDVIEKICAARQPAEHPHTGSDSSGR